MPNIRNMVKKSLYPGPYPVVLFDGYCKLCNGTVNFLIDRDPHRRLRFATLQSDAGRQLIQQFGLQEKELNTVILIDRQRAYIKSTAILRSCRYLVFPWPLVNVLWIIPRCLRDWMYDLVAKNRYRWFGRQNSCRMPSPDLEDRFLA